MGQRAVLVFRPWALAFYEEGQAESIHAAKRLTHNITQPMLDQYNGALGSPESYTNAAYGVLGGAAPPWDWGRHPLPLRPAASADDLGSRGGARAQGTHGNAARDSAIPLAGPGFGL